MLPRFSYCQVCNFNSFKEWVKPIRTIRFWGILRSWLSTFMHLLFHHIRQVKIMSVQTIHGYHFFVVSNEIKLATTHVYVFLQFVVNKIVDIFNATCKI